MQEEALVIVGIFISLVVSSQCPVEHLEEEQVGCFARGEKDEDRSRCYYIYKTKDVAQSQQPLWTLDQAAEVCSCHNKQLPVRMTDNARIVVSESLKNLSPLKGAWLLGKKKVTDKWVNNQMVAMETNDLINSDESHECAYIIREGDGVKLKPELCSTNKDFRVVCQTGTCDASYRGCLKVESQSNLTWFDARSLCKKNGGDILSFEDSSDISGLNAQLSQLVKYWVGVRKAVWLWNDTAEIDDFHWAPNEPSSKGESCMALTPDGNWEDVTCSLQQHALCWKDEKTSGLGKDVTAGVIGGIVAAVIVTLIIIVALVAVLLRRARKPPSDSDIDSIRRKSHVKKRNTEIKMENGTRFSDISDNINLEEMPTKSL